MTGELLTGFPLEPATFCGLLTDFREGVLTVTFDRPEVSNGLSIEMSAALEKVLEAVEDDPRVRVLVLTGTGRNFSAGGDLDLVERNFIACRTSREAALALQKPPQHLTDAIEDFPKPVIAAVNGAAAGMGMAMALAADIIVADSDTVFLYAYTTLGVPGDGGITRRLVQRTGIGRALELAYFGRPLDAETAHRWGVVNFLATDDQTVLDLAHSLADRLAAGPAIAQAGVKRAMRKQASREEHAEIEIDAFIEAAQHDDVFEGLNALREKRRPVFGDAQNKADTTSSSARTARFSSQEDRRSDP